MMKSLVFEFAASQEEARIRRLLSEVGLPNEDVRPHLPHFILLNEGSELIGCVGLELWHGAALLRSLAVATPYQGKGLGKALCERITDYAREKGVRKLYLLTTNQGGFFERLGFSRMSREEAPAEVRATTQFTAICPSTAVLMTKQLI